MSGWITAAAAVVAVAGGTFAAREKAKAAKRAAGQQEDKYWAGITEQERRLVDINDMLAPYTSAGKSAIGEQQNILGLNGADKQKQYYDNLQASPQFNALSQQGENALSQNASATGGLRGGNFQAALSQFRPQLLNSLMNQQFSQLGGLATQGLNATQLSAQATQNKGNISANILGQIGSAQAGASLAQGSAAAAPYQGISDVAAAYTGGSLGAYFKNGGGSFTQPGGGGQ